MDQGSIEISKGIYALSMASLDYWQKNSVFTWRWWIAISFTIAPWIVWIFVRKKESIDRLLYAGIFAMLFSSLIDFFGVSYNLWYYCYKILPLFPSYIPWDFSLIPVSIMILLQYKPNSHLAVKALFFGAFSAFVAEPFFHWLKLYFPIHWRYLYSFPLYILLFLMCYFLVKRSNFEEL